MDLQEYFDRAVEWQGEIRRRTRSARFSERAESVLNKLVDESFEKVRRYSTEKLARIFYECIQWVGERPRQDTDWYFAERCIDEFLGEQGIREFAQRVIILGGYETLPSDVIQRISSGNPRLPKDDRRVLDHGGLPILLPYMEQMKKLSDEQLMDHLFTGWQLLPQNIDVFLGRPVWEIYQDVRDSPKTLPQGYGKIRFS